MSGEFDFTSKDRCPKCGLPFSREYGRVPEVRHRPGHGEEHLECECPRCGYIWNEPTLDNRPE